MVRRRCPVIDLLNWNCVLWIFHTYMCMYEFTVLLFYRMDCKLFVRPLWDAQWDKCLPHWLFWVVAHFPREGNINAKFVIAYGDLYGNPCCYKPVQFKPSIMNLEYCHYCYTMVTWKVFTQHTTMHGIKNIHMEKIHLARR